MCILLGSSLPAGPQGLAFCCNLVLALVTLLGGTVAKESVREQLGPILLLRALVQYCAGATVHRDALVSWVQMARAQQCFVTMVNHIDSMLGPLGLMDKASDF